MTQLPIVAADAFLALAAFSTAAVVLPGSESVWNYLPVFLCGVGLAGLPTGMFKIVGVHPIIELRQTCLLYTSPSPRDQRGSRMPSSA